MSYTKKFTCYHCGKKIEDSRAELDLKAQQFCSEKCYQIYEFKKRVNLQETSPKQKKKAIEDFEKEIDARREV